MDTCFLMNVFFVLKLYGNFDLGLGNETVQSKKSRQIVLRNKIETRHPGKIEQYSRAQTAGKHGNNLAICFLNCALLPHKSYF